MRNRLLFGWRQVVVFAVVASFALGPVFAGAKDQLTPVISGSQASQGVKRVDRDGQETVSSVVPLTLYARSNYVWPFSVAPPYGNPNRGPEGRGKGVLRTMVGDMSIGEMSTRLPQELRTRNILDKVSLQYFIIDLDPAFIAAGGVNEVQSVVTAAGGEVVGGMPSTAVIARLSRNALTDVQTLQGVSAVAPYPAAFKLHPEIGKRPLANPIKAVSEVYDLDVTLFPGENGTAVGEAIVALGGEVTAISGRSVRASLNRAKLGELAEIQGVLSIHEAIPNRPAGEESTITMQTGGFQGRGTIGPYHLAGINGSGNGVAGTTNQVLMVIDTGVQLDASDLADTDTLPGAAGPAHRKVVAYRPASSFSGLGDDQGCDAGPQGGSTHGHIVAAAAVGNATEIIDLSTGWDPLVKKFAADANDLDWALDGVAPGAKVSILDASVTPAATSCDDPAVNYLTIGPNFYNDLADPTAACPGLDCPGFLQVGYRSASGDGARVFNMSFGSSNQYGSEPRQIDEFLYNRQDAMVFAAAGNAGTDFDNDGVPDLGSVHSPSTNKNGLSIGATGNASLFDGAENRIGTSSIGPARVDGGTLWESDPSTSLDRVQPVLMAPGGDGGTLGVGSEFVCRSNDNDSIGAVECDITDGNGGTSFASPNAAGAAMLVRDYFAQGFYPSGAQVTADAVPTISGALLKALLVSSADFLNGGGTPTGYRFNNEQGYGRIQLDNVLPLQTWAQSVSGLIVADGGIVGGPNNLSGINGLLDGTVAGETDTQDFEVCAPEDSLRVSLAWMDRVAVGDVGTLNTDLDLELVSPSGRVYYGNYFTDDDDRSKVLDAPNEDCPDFHGNTGVISQGQWSLPVCFRDNLTLSPHDVANNTEAIFLSADSDGDGVDIETDDDPSDDDQIEIGTWTVRVKVKDTNPDGNPFVPSVNADSAQSYALVIAGAGCLGSSVRFDSGTYSCNQTATVTVNELPEAPALNAVMVSGRTTVEVFDGLGALMDTESGLSFTRNGSTESYVGNSVFLTDATARDAGNGVLDVRDGDRMRVTYTDTQSGNTEISEASVDCALRITSGAITFAQFGLDTGTIVQGGCERNARGLFEFGFPDRYPDAEERLILGVAIGSQETIAIDNIDASLRCVEANDTFAPSDCLPGTTNCSNPERLTSGTCTTAGPGNTDACMTACPASWLSITNSPITIAQLPSNAAIGINFNLAMGADLDIPDMQEVEFVLDLTSPTSGRGGISTAIFRNILDADVLAVLYSTDFPTGGTEFADWNNNELLEGNSSLIAGDMGFTQPVDNAGDFFRDYRFETRVFSDMTANGKNAEAAANAPWNFNTNDGGFRNGIAAPTDDEAIIDTVAQWGEDKNFNNLLDGFCSLGTCDGDPSESCNFDVDCVNGGFGSVCLFAAQGWCGGVVSGTQCTDLDDPLDLDLTPEDCETAPEGVVCELVTCQDTATLCVLQSLSGMRCISESEDVDPANQMLESAWSVQGGCGWQTAEAGECSNAATPCYIDGDCPGGTCTGTAPARGAWHTGLIGVFGQGPGCLGAGNSIDQCQGIETVGGETGERLWFELLVTPKIQKVDDTASSVNIINFAWNQAIDLEDSNVGWSWEVDGDTDAINPVDLTSDQAVLNLGFGSYTPLAGSDHVSENNPDLTNGYSLFAPLADTDNHTQNGTLGENRHGQNSCYFEGSAKYPLLTLAEFGLAGPLDDDLNNGHCPGERGRLCTAFCTGGTLDTAPCSTTGGGDVACTNGGGVCSATSLDPTYNRCEVTDTCVAATSCSISGAACAVDADCRFCVFDNSTIDEYVKPNGPIRNMDLTAFNGPDLRFTTVEDLAGETGSTFQAAIGMVNFEKEDTAADDPQTAYGIGVDDVVFEWQEFTIVPDASDCGVGGSCANIDSSVGASFNSATFLDITVQDTSPSNNDCDDNGDNTSPGDDTDCDNDGVADVRVTGKSLNETAGERLNLNCTNPSGSTCPDGEYAGSLPVSATYNSPGVVFVQAQGVIAPVVEMNYFDYDDGTGQVCQNSLLASANGLVQAFTVINLSGGNVALIDVSVSDNGDNDVWADTSETVQMKITLRNQTGILLNNVQAKLASNDPKIDCILTANINIGTMFPDDPATVAFDEGVVASSGAFEFRISDSANRQGVCSNAAVACSLDADCGAGTCNAELIKYGAELNVFLSADEFDTAFVDQVTTIPLDLDAIGGGVPAELFEGFEGGMGIFDVNNIDSATPADGAVIKGIPGSGGFGASLENSDGFRCSFADPDYINAFTYGDPDCFMGIDITHANDIWYEVITERAFEGLQSLHYGIYTDDVLRWTTPMGTIEAVETVAPLSLGFSRICSAQPLLACPNGDVDCGGGINSCIEAKPRVVWKHQISLMDFRGLNTSGPLRSADGGVIHVQLANPINDSAVGDWIKVETVSNQYDSQIEDNYNVCTFDPIDDGSTEDDFFDPSDPFRRYGPSSTCFPEFVYSYMGDTDTAFDAVAGLGNATQGPGLEGSVGLGTWVESVVDLAQFRAQYVRVRMMSTGIKLAATWQAAFNYAESRPQDDGWFIDDFRVKDAVSFPAVLEGDAKPNLSVCSGDGTTACVDNSDCGGLGTCQFPQCGVTCNTITADLDSDPAGSIASPGQAIELSALGSTADRCVGGVLQFRFWIDANTNSTLDTGELVRNWSENGILLQAPGDDTRYATDVRCSALNSCIGTAFNDVDVICPDSSLFFPTITADGSNGKNDFQWAGPLNYAIAEGTMASLGDPTYPQTFSNTGLNGANHTLVSGTGHYVLLRTDNPLAGGQYCNENGGPGNWDGGGALGRDSSNLP